MQLVVSELMVKMTISSFLPTAPLLPISFCSANIHIRPRAILTRALRLIVFYQSHLLIAKIAAQESCYFLAADAFVGREGGIRSAFGDSRFDPPGNCPGIAEVGLDIVKCPFMGGQILITHS